MSELDFIEACHEPADTDAEWGARLAERVARVVPEALAVMGGAYRIDTTGGFFSSVTGDARLLGRVDYRRSIDRAVESSNASPQGQALLARSFALGGPHVTVLSDLPMALGATIRDNLPAPATDCLGCFGSLDGNRGYVLSPVAPGRLQLSRQRRRQLTRLSEHLATGYWLRALRAPGSPLDGHAVAVCTPDGRVLHDSGKHPEFSARLVDAVRNMDRARCRRKKRTPEEAAELWQALLAGQYTLVESSERNGRRLILAVRCRTPRPALTQREAAIAAAAARGAANKTIAAELGVATGTVGVHLAAAMRKLSCPSRRALAQWLGAPRVERSS